MKYIDKTTFICKESRQIEAYELLTSEMRKVIEVVKKMDGKVLNARFDKAIKDAGVVCYFANKRQWDINKWRYELSAHSQDVSVFSGVRESKKGEQIPFHGYIEYSSSEFSISVNSEKRIDAEETVKSINDTIGYMQASIKKRKYAIEHYDEIALRTQNLMEEIRKFHSEIPNFARPYFYANDCGPILELDE